VLEGGVLGVLVLGGVGCVEDVGGGCRVETDDSWMADVVFSEMLFDVVSFIDDIVD
jgi:hypothetical protein